MPCLKCLQYPTIFNSYPESECQCGFLSFDFCLLKLNASYLWLSFASHVINLYPVWRDDVDFSIECISYMKMCCQKSDTSPSLIGPLQVLFGGVLHGVQWPL